MAEIAEYASEGRESPPKVKRLWLGAALGAVFAVVAVTFIALVIIVVGRTVLMVLFGGAEFIFSGSSPWFTGAGAALLAAVLNWYVFWISIPIATLVLRFSLGRLAHRRTVRRFPYLRWGMIWGAILVAAPSALAGVIFRGLSGPQIGPDGTVAAANHADTAIVLLSSGLTGAVIGTLAGYAVARLFLMIVKPERQIRDIDPAIFT